MLQLAAVEAIKLDTFDPLLSESDVPGAYLPSPIDIKVERKHLARWLECRGVSTWKLNKAELIER